MMNSRAIDYFESIVRYGGINKAAAATSISQPTISRSILQLEIDLGFKLFSRGRGAFELTLEGEAFAKEIEASRAGMTYLETAALRIRSMGGGVLRIACPNSLSLTVMPAAIERIYGEIPDLNISLHVHSTSTIWHKVRTLQADFGLARFQTNLPEVKAEKMFSVGALCAVSTRHRLAARAKIQPADLQGEPFLTFMPGSEARRRIDHVLTTAGAQVQVRLETQFASTLCAMVEKGIGVALVDPIVAQEFEHLQIRLIRFEPRVAFDMYALYPDGRARSRLVTRFMAILRETCGSMGIPLAH